MVLLEGPIGPRAMCYLRVEVIPPRGVLAAGPRVVRAIVDTGAEASVLTDRVASELHLPMEGVDEVTLGFAEPVTCMVTAADLVFHTMGPRQRHGVYTMRSSLFVARGEFDPDFDLLLGADAWEEGELRIHYPHQRWSFRTADGVRLREG